HGWLAIQEPDERLASRILAWMGACAGNAAAEDQHAALVIEQRLPRRLGAKALRFAPVVVADDRDTGKIGSLSPEVGLFPSVREEPWRHDHHVRSRSRTGERHGFCEFSQTRAGARAVGMHQHDECRAVARAREYRRG